MWLSFFCLSVSLIVILIVPGFLTAYGVSGDRLLSLLGAPLITVFLLSTISILNSAFGLFSRPSLVLVELICIASIVFLSGRVVCKKPHLAMRPFCSSSYRIVIFAFAFALVVAVYNYVIPLDGPSSFVQDSDNSFHLSLIRSFAESGNWSSLSVSVYAGMGANLIAPSGGGFYPAAWHALAAFVCDMAGGDPCIAANVVNFAMLCIVFPFSSLLLFSVLFPSGRCAQVAGMVMSFAFSSFPWGTLLSVSGPLFPNTLGFSLVPACAALLIMFVRSFSERHLFPGALPRLTILLLIGLIALGLAHPNAVFTLVVFVAPFILFKVFFFTERLGSASKRALILCCAVVIFAVIWVSLYFSPFLYGTTHFRWDSTASLSQAIVNCFALSFRMPACSMVVPIVVAAGVFSSIKKWKQYGWLTCSFFFACLIYVVGASTDGVLKGLLSGFWYTDPYRLGASACVIALPLAALGASSIVTLLKRGFKTLGFKSAPSSAAISLIAVVAIFFSYIGNYSIPGFSKITTGFGDYRWCTSISNSYDRPNLFDEQEKAFCEKVANIVGEDLVYNNADDGSVFAYPLYGINLVYKRTLGDGRENIDSEERVLCENLNKINEDSKVKEILQRSSVKYILNLDYGGEPLDERCYYGAYDPDDWSGMNALSDDNPSLKVVLSEGDCRLYEIVY